MVLLALVNIIVASIVYGLLGLGIGWFLNKFLGLDVLKYTGLGGATFGALMGILISLKYFKVKKSKNRDNFFPFFDHQIL